MKASKQLRNMGLCLIRRTGADDINGPTAGSFCQPGPNEVTRQ